MAPSTKTLIEGKTSDPGEASPGHTITAYLNGRQCLPGEYSLVTPTPDSSGCRRSEETKTSPQNWRLRTTTDMLRTKQVWVNTEPFQMLDQEFV